VVIGKRWLDAHDDAGQRRLDNPADFVRLETASALKREAITVVPVLIGGAAMPEAKDLPDDLQALAYRNAAPLSHLRWQSDLDVLADELHRVLHPDAEEAPEPARPTARRLAAARRQRRLSWPLIAALAAAAVVAVPGGFWAWGSWEVKRAEDAARIAKAEADRVQAVAVRERAEAEDAERRRQDQQVAADQTRREAEQAQAAASAAQAAAVAAAARNDQEATRLAQAREEEARRQAAEKEETARRELAAAEAARLEAEQKAQQDRLAQENLARAAAQVSAANDKVRSAGGRNLVAEVGAVPTPEALLDAGPPAAGAARGVTIDWRLSANCGGKVEARGPATFLVRRDGDGVLVGVRLALAGGGYSVTAESRQRFDKPQQSYQIATTAEWKGPREFSSQQAFEVYVRDGASFAKAEQRGFRTICP
jgi:hypothetical protein